MRFELGGSQIVPDPLVLTYTANGTFVPQTYIDQGYTNFDVICIGGGGGAGGGQNNATLRSYGGAGGGGGLQRVKGLLKYLSASCPVVVGAGGLGGANGTTPTHGQNGGASTFNGTTCQASGGEWGDATVTNSLTGDPQGWGGDGGVGGRTAAGGGGIGGTTGANGSASPVPNAIDGIDGSYINGIGKGGGGGAGGMAKADGTLYLVGSAGGRGSYNLTDTSVFGPGASESLGITSGVTPGGAGGAKAAPLNGLPTVYGQSVTTPAGSNPSAGMPGVVVLRLTAE